MRYLLSLLFWLPMLAYGQLVNGTLANGKVFANIQAYSAGFSPTNLSNLALWLKADDGPSASIDGSAVTYWTNKSGAGNFTTNWPIFSQPKIKTGVLNGLPTLRFDGTEDYFGLATADISRNVAGETIITVARSTVATGSQRFIFFSSCDSSGPTRIGLIVNNVAGKFTVGGRRVSGDSFTSSTSATSLNTNTFYLISGVLDYSAAGHSAYIRLNGSQESINTSFFTSNTPDTDSTGCFVANSSANGATGFIGDIAEILVYKRVLTTTELQRVETYLNGKYSIY